MRTMDPRKLRSREKLQEAYLTMLLRGKEQFTIQELCDEAKVTRPTFYKLFKDTNELRLNIHERTLEDLKKSLTLTNLPSLAEIDETDMPKSLILLFQHILNWHVVYETFFVYQPDALFINGVKEILKQYVTDGIKSAQTDDNMFRARKDLVISFGTGAHIECIVFWIKENYATSPEEMAKSLTELAIYGPYVKKPR